jgi:hypothetical protein
MCSREDERLDFHGARVTPHLVVEVAEEMDEALWLATRDSVIAGREIRDEDARIGLQDLLYHSGRACGSHFEDDRHALSQAPDIIMGALDADVRLSSVHEGARQEPVDEEAFGRCLGPGNVVDNMDRGPDPCALTKHILGHVDDDAVRQAKDEAWVNHPDLNGRPT